MSVGALPVGGVSAYHEDLQAQQREWVSLIGPESESDDTDDQQAEMIYSASDDEFAVDRVVRHRMIPGAKNLSYLDNVEYQVGYPGYAALEWTNRSGLADNLDTAPPYRLTEDSEVNTAWVNYLEDFLHKHSNDDQLAAIELNRCQNKLRAAQASLDLRRQQSARVRAEAAPPRVPDARPGIARPAQAPDNRSFWLRTNRTGADLQNMRPL